MKANKLTKTLSFLVAFAMVFTMMPLSIFAKTDVDIQAEKQIDTYGSTAYYKADGTAGSNTAYDVSIAKTVAATGTENLFNVTVNVTYKNATTTVTSNDAATTLVIDTSGSMSWCSECGAYYTYNSGTTLYTDTDGVVKCGNPKCANYQKPSQSRLTAAKAAACAFLDSYAKDKDGKFYTAARMVSLVSFAGYAYEYDFGSILRSEYWINVNNADNLQKAKDAINAYKADGGTYTQDGMETAASLLNTTTYKTAIGSISNRFCVLLTDGQPTYYKKTDSSRGGNGSSTNYNEVSGTETGCKAVTATGAKIYAIAYGLQNDQVPVTKGPNPTQMLVSSWLTSADHCGATAAYTPANQAGLTEAFNKILTSTTTTGSGVSNVIDAMTASDAGASDKVINFVQFNNANGASETATTGAIAWDLSKATADTNAPSGYTSYTMTYQVRLDNTGANFIDKHTYSLAAATLTYINAADKQQHTATSAVPQVKGYLGTLEFTKTGLNGTKLSGAEFKLANTANSYTATSSAVAGPEGAVSFTRIPSGFNYTLTETKAPANYVKSDASYTVTVRYGVVTVSNGTEALSSFTTFTNALDPKPTTVKVSKSWSDGAAAHESDSVTVTLMKKIGTAESVADGTATLSKAGNWQATFANKPTIDAATGAAITYSVVENAVSGYTARYGTAADGTLTITNIRSENGTVTVTKNWIVPENYNKTTIKVDLYRQTATGSKEKVETVTLSAEGSWTWSKTLPQYDDTGAAYTYSVENEQGQAVDVTPSYGGTGNNLTVTNTINNSTTSLTVSKVWKDAALVSSRPNSVTVVLLKNRNQTTTSITLNSENSWSATINNLPIYDIENGTVTVNTYGVSELTLGTPYSSAVTGGKQDDGTYNYTVTNTLTGTVSVSGAKTWVDQDNADKTRPDSITVTLYRSVSGDAEGTRVASITLTAATANGIKTWPTTYDFGEQAKYDANGNEYIYSVRESGQGNAYTAAYPANTYDITNTLNAGEQTIEVTKTWVDNHNTYATRPETLTVNLSGDGKTYSQTLNVNTNDSQTATFTVPVYNANGEKITYTCGEGNEASNYDTAINQQSFTITNTLKPGTIDVSVSKVWVDGSNAQGLRPENVIFQLYANNAPVEGKTLTFAGTGDTWTGVFTGLPEYENGVRIVYTVQETGVNANYDAATNNLTVTNTLKNPNKTINVNKVWVDGGLAHASAVTAVLSGNGKTYEAELSKNNSWTGSFTVPTYDDQYQTIAYTLTEKGVTDGTTVYNGKNYTVGISAGTITNTLVQEYIDILVTKTWIGPDSTGVQVGLFQNDTQIATGTLTKNIDGAWTYTFDHQPVYNDSRSAYTYSVRELDAHGKAVEDQGTVVYGSHTYTAAYSGSYGANILNTVVQEKTSLTTTKSWANMVEGHGYKAEYPTSIVLQLYANGVASGDPVTVSKPSESGDLETASADWTYTFENLDVFSLGETGNGQPIVYTVKEGTLVNSVFTPVENNGTIVYGTNTFTVTYANNTITNTYVTPIKYYYRVDYQYITNYSDGTAATTSNVGGTEMADGTLNQVIAPTAEATRLYDGGTYSYNASKSTPTVTINEANKVFVVTLVYERTLHVLNVKYVFNDSYKAEHPTEFVDFTVNTEGVNTHFAPGAAYSTVSARLAAPSGYAQTDITNSQGGNVETGTFGDADVTVTYFYTKIVVPVPDYSYYTVTVNYLNQADNSVLAQPHSETHREYTSYDVTAYDKIAIEGYTYAATSGDQLTGTLNGNKVINVYYTVNEPVIIPDEPTPGGDKPVTPTTPTEPTNPGTEIIDDNTPMGNLPNTGAPADVIDPVTTLGLVALILSMLAAGLGITHNGRRKDEDDAQ